MYALIHPVNVERVAAWQGDEPVMEPIPNSARVCQLEEAVFDVAPPLEWIECPDGVTAGIHYYNTLDNTFLPITHAERT